MKTSNLKRAILLLQAFWLINLNSCKNYYNDTIEWTDTMSIGLDIQTVKSSQPDFIEVDWSKPDTFENSLLYNITAIKGSNDFINMSHYLVFKNGKYQGRKSRK